MKDPIIEQGMYCLRLTRRLRKDADAGNEYARRVLEEEG